MCWFQPAACLQAARSASPLHYFFENKQPVVSAGAHGAGQPHGLRAVGCIPRARQRGRRRARAAVSALLVNFRSMPQSLPPCFLTCLLASCLHALCTWA